MIKIFKQINRTQRGFTFNNEEQEVHGLEVDKTYDLSDIHRAKPRKDLDFDDEGDEQ